MAKKAKVKSDKKKKDEQSKMEMRAAAIAACRDKSGHVTPKAVVRAAKEPTHILHDEFDWDVDRAANAEWERRAAELIRSVRFIVTYEDKKFVVPVYVSDPRADESSYMPTLRIAKSGSLSKQVLRDELQRIKGAIHRAVKLAAVFGLVPNFQRMLDQALEIERELPSDNGSGRATVDEADAR